MKKLVSLFVGVFLGIVAALVISVNPVLAGGSAEIKVDGKSVDLKRLTTEELVQLADLINKAAGKTPSSVKKSENSNGLIDVNFITRDEGPVNLCYPPVCSLFGLFCC